MTQISKKFVKPETLEKTFDLLLASLLKSGGKADTKEFLEDLLTPTEKVMIAKRIAIAYLLLQEVDHRTISEMLKVSTSTINRISFVLNRQGAGFKRVLKRLLREKKINNILEEVGELLFNSLPPKYGDKRAWAKEKFVRKMTRQSPLS
ncbi:MAG: Trp family transcriptional regulator [Candidatus Shapirobacteria bacterium]